MGKKRSYGLFFLAQPVLFEIMFLEKLLSAVQQPAIQQPDGAGKLSKTSRVRVFPLAITSLLYI